MSDAIKQQNEDTIAYGALKSQLVKHFGVLPAEVRIQMCQQCAAPGLTNILEARKRELQTDLINIDSTDPIQLAKDYTMLRMELVFVDDMIDFLKYAAAYYVEQARQES